MLSEATPILLAMGGAVHHCGSLGGGAVVRLMVNTLFAAQVAAMAELLAMVAGEGGDPGLALRVFSETPVSSPAAKGAGAGILARAIAPAFPVDLVCKDLGVALAIGADLPLAARVAETFARLKAAGHGASNITGIARLYPALSDLPPA